MNLRYSVQEFNGLDHSKEPRNGVSNDLSSLSFQMNRFEDDLSDTLDAGTEFPSKVDSSRNPFLATSDSPKKAAKLFTKSSEMMMVNKNNKYDVFKNEIVKRPEVPVPPQQANTKAKTDANPDLFKDFAIAAFGEFKVDKTSSMIHEFSNRLSDQKNLQNGHQMMKVIPTRKSDRLCKCLEPTNQ